MEINSEKENNNLNFENDNSNNSKENDPNEYPFKMITKEQEKEEIPKINENENLENIINDNKNNKQVEENEKNERKKTLINNNLSSIQNNSISNEKKNKTILKKKSKNKVNLNNLSPDIYMGKKMQYTEPNTNPNPIDLKLKKIEELIQKQIDYDYKRTMKEIKDELDNNKKNKEQQKHILEEDKKMKDKLKLMEEYRENKLKEKAEKVIKKQNRLNKNIVKNKSLKKRNMPKLDNGGYSNSYDNYEKTAVSINRNKNKKRLPPISSTPNYMLKKEMIEKEFIENTDEIIKSLDLFHKENYLLQYNKSSEKIKEHNKKHDERNGLYSKYRSERELIKAENLIKKDIDKRYNIRQTLLRDRSVKIGKLKEQIKKNLENFKEKKEILEHNENEKIKKILAKINKNVKASNNYINIKDKRQYYSNLQKNNLNKEEKKFEIKYNDYLYQQQDLKNYNNDLQKEDSYIRNNIYQNIQDKYNENEKKFESFHQFLEKAVKNDIINKPDKVKFKLYKKKVREENEERIRKEEEAQNK